ncbi:MAG TPA: cobalamin-dependent protein [Oscillospiraceae bacterium]|nr:cobalamin-dependent protein [Oscillospiraceae bacterium]
MSGKLFEAIVDMRDKDALQLTQEMLDNGVNPRDILAECQEAMAEVGRLFEAKEYFLPELMMSGEMLKQISEILKPLMEGSADEGEKLGRVVLGTVKGDIHDIGKDIVAFMLEINGFEVFDVGIDQPPQVFVDKIKEVNPHVVGLSGFLTVAFNSMRDTVEMIKEAGLREQVKIMIGGGTVTEDLVGYTGADAFGQDAMTAVQLSKTWVKE